MDAQIDFKKGDAILPEQAMRLAIEVAMAGAPYVSPNPLVGCVAVDSEHKFLDFGFHPRYGMEHAEINVLNKLSKAEIQNSTFYVTLESCAHEGKTGSCAKKLATLPIKKVAERIKQLRINSGYTSYETFAYDKEFNRVQYWRIENGGNITLKTFFKILEIHKLSPEEFFKDFN